jgi:hypothetical protein
MERNYGLPGRVASTEQIGLLPVFIETSYEKAIDREAGLFGD